MNKLKLILGSLSFKTEVISTDSREELNLDIFVSEKHFLYLKPSVWEGILTVKKWTIALEGGLISHK